MKKYLLAFGLSLAASSSWAVSNEKLAQTCFNTGAQKVISQAQEWGCQVNADQIEVQDIDNRWYNPSKYIWYQAVVPCNGLDRVVKMVQYSDGKCL